MERRKQERLAKQSTIGIQGLFPIQFTPSHSKRVAFVFMIPIALVLGMMLFIKIKVNYTNSLKVMLYRYGHTDTDIIRYNIDTYTSNGNFQSEMDTAIWDHI